MHPQRQPRHREFTHKQIAMLQLGHHQFRLAIPQHLLAFRHQRQISPLCSLLLLRSKVQRVHPSSFLIMEKILLKENIVEIVALKLCQVFWSAQIVKRVTLPKLQGLS
jgi:hypothetical protein